jgi:hypothetical protein
VPDVAFGEKNDVGFCRAHTHSSCCGHRGNCCLLVRGRNEGGFEFTFQTVVSAYLALVIGASLIVATVGAARLLGALMSDAFGRSFTYQSYSFVENPRPVLPPGATDPQTPSEVEQRQRYEETERARLENKYRDDIVYGVTMLVVGLFMFGVHTAGRQFLRRRRGEPALIARSYLILMLISTSVVALVSLVTAIASVVRRYVLETVGPDRVMSNPGESVALALAFLPLWLWFLYRALREVAGPKPETAA